MRLDRAFVCATVGSTLGSALPIDETQSGRSSLTNSRAPSPTQSINCVTSAEGLYSSCGKSLDLSRGQVGAANDGAFRAHEFVRRDEELLPLPQIITDVQTNATFLTDKFHTSNRYIFHGVRELRPEVQAELDYLQGQANDLKNGTWQNDTGSLSNQGKKYATDLVNSMVKVMSEIKAGKGSFNDGERRNVHKELDGAKAAANNLFEDYFGHSTAASGSQVPPLGWIIAGTAAVAGLGAARML